LTDRPPIYSRLDDSTKQGDPQVREHTLLRVRWLAAVGAALAAWVAIDSLMGSGLASEAVDDPEFFLFWGAPFACVAVFLGWYALRGGRLEVREVARSGCLAGVFLGGGVFLLYLASPLFLPWDALSGAVAAFLYGPMAAVLGLGIGISLGAMRKRRP